jgi:hypothetical protein
MSMGTIAGNVVLGARGVGIYCGDYPHCSIADNFVSGTTLDRESGDRTRAGFAIVSHFGAKARIHDNRLIENPKSVRSFSNGTILHR